MNRDQEVLGQLKAIIDPDLGKDIVTLGFIKNLKIDDAGAVSFAIELTTPACPVKDQFKRAAETAVRKLSWVTAVAITMTAQPRGNPLISTGPGLKDVATIIAVSSCKGGVGKSTVAVNLAYALKNLGAAVGIFDADIYGPSLPTMVSPEERRVFQDGDLIRPLDYEGVKLMSFGFVTAPQGGGPAIMRGPMVSQVINQLLTQTAWGELDYLVLDLPPGTGDIQLTLTQLIPITAALIVTTPQELSFVDVVKGIQMFDKLKVPVAAVVENMSYFQCDCGKKHYLFGTGARRRLVEQFGIQNSFEIPIRTEVSQLSDKGTPVVLAGSPEAAQPYRDAAEALVREVSRLKFGTAVRPKVAYAGGRGIVVTTGDGKEHVLPSAQVRRRCRCAMCIEEFSGRQLLKPEAVADSVFPKSIAPMGNYAVAMTWSDGHTSSVYPYDALLKMAAEFGG